jgi:RHS repeat-associated protein
VDFSYDGRELLGTAVQAGGGTDSVDALYDSGGTLHRLLHNASGASDAQYVFYLAGRPVAQLAIDDLGAETWSYLTTDHLGTPILATDGAGDETWYGGFEPFGRDWQAGTGDGALENGMFLRLPGQWDSGTWAEAAMGGDLYYNVHRWLESSTGRYTRPDPIKASHNDYVYVDARPVLLVDPNGLLAFDPESCEPFRNKSYNNSPELCCLDELEKAVQDYNEFFAKGWRQ